MANGSMPLHVLLHLESGCLQSVLLGPVLMGPSQSALPDVSCACSRLPLETSSCSQEGWGKFSVTGISPGAAEVKSLPMAPGRRGGSPSKENNSLLFFPFLLIFSFLKQIEAYSRRCVVEKKKEKKKTEEERISVT